MTGAGMTLRRSLQLYAAIVLLYVALMSWWVYFFWNESAMLVQHMGSAGADLSAAQALKLQEVTARHGRMFFGESAFLGLLMVASVWFVVRAMRREQVLAEQQRNFLSAVTHELRSPIASARLYLETLQLGRAEGEKAERYLRHAHEDLTRLQSLVEQLLEGRRLAQVGPALNLEPLDLATLVTEQVAQLDAMHGGTGRLRMAGAAPARVLGDPAALARVLDNLVSNAVKYGGPAGEVEVSVASHAGQAVLSVRDHGPGLQGADPVEIFKPFVRGDVRAVANRPGVGLGLFIVRELVAAHCGSVSARDGVPGGGTELRVELPLHTDDPAPPGEVPA